MSLREAAQALIKSWDRDPQGIWSEMEFLRDALAEAEKAESAELSDEDIEEIWWDTVRDVPRGSTNRQIRVACIRAVLAAARAEAPKAIELSDEQIRALRESHAFDAEWRYFEPRPVSDSATSRKAFADGFERGWDAALAAARGKK